jgi:PAS domain S-box-containing protein
MLHARIDSTAQKLAVSGIAGAQVRECVRLWAISKRKGEEAMEVARLTTTQKGIAVLSSGGGIPAYMASVSASRAIKTALEQSSQAKLGEASNALEKALIQLVALLGITLAFFVLFAWLESRHRRMLSELEETHRNLNDSEERFKRAYEEAGVGMALVDLNFHLLTVNRAMSDMMGFDRNELVGHPVAALLDPGERDAATSRFRELVSGAVESYRTEHLAVRKDGKSIWSRNSVSLLRAGGKATQVLLITEDISCRPEPDCKTPDCKTDDGTALP